MEFLLALTVFGLGLSAVLLCLYLAYLLGFEVTQDDIYFMRDHELNGYYLRLLLKEYRPEDFKRLHSDGGQDLRLQIFIGIMNDLRRLAKHYPGVATRAWLRVYSLLTKPRISRTSSRLALAALRLEISYCAWVRKSYCANS